MNAFMELRNHTKRESMSPRAVIYSTTSERPKDLNTLREQELIREKVSLEQTLVALTEEVESLSKRNEEFLRDLRARHDFYGAYQESQEELRKLREAH